MAYVLDDDYSQLPPPPTRAEVEADLVDWEQRLSDLLDQIQDWAAARPDFRPVRNHVHRSERKMVLVGMTGTQALPNLILHRYGLDGQPTGKMVHIGPDARWVIGTRGQISIRTPKTIHTVADGGKTGAPEWLCTSIRGKPPQPFTKDLLLMLLDEVT